MNIEQTIKLKEILVTGLPLISILLVVLYFSYQKRFTFAVAFICNFLIPAIGYLVVLVSDYFYIPYRDVDNPPMLFTVTIIWAISFNISIFLWNYFFLFKKKTLFPRILFTLFTSVIVVWSSGITYLLISINSFGYYS